MEFYFRLAACTTLRTPWFALWHNTDQKWLYSVLNKPISITWFPLTFFASKLWCLSVCWENTSISTILPKTRTRHRLPDYQRRQIHPSVSEKLTIIKIVQHCFLWIFNWSVSRLKCNFYDFKAERMVLIQAIYVKHTCPSISFINCRNPQIIHIINHHCKKTYSPFFNCSAL